MAGVELTLLGKAALIAGRAAGNGARTVRLFGWRERGWRSGSGTRRMRLGRPETLNVPWQPAVQVELREKPLWG